MDLEWRARALTWCAFVDFMVNLVCPDRCFVAADNNSLTVRS